jgi:hypothetical protein
MQVQGVAFTAEDVALIVQIALHVQAIAASGVANAAHIHEIARNGDVAADAHGSGEADGLKTAVVDAPP